MKKKAIVFLAIMVCIAGAVFVTGRYIVPAFRADNDPTGTANTANSTDTGDTSTTVQDPISTSGNQPDQTSGSEPGATTGGDTKPGESTPAQTADGTTEPNEHTGPSTEPSKSSEPPVSSKPTDGDPGNTQSIYPLQVSPDKRYLVDQNGNPFFPVIDTGWMLFSYINEEDAEYYLEERRKSGVNTILSYAAPFVVGMPNANGDAAFIDDDIAKPNDAYFDYVAKIINKAAEKGMQIILCPMELCNYSDYCTVENCKELGRYIAKRFKDCDNLMWFSGGDVHPNYAQIQYSDAFVQGFREFDTEHIMSFHPAGGNSSADYFNDYDWLDYNMVQVFSPDSPKSYSLMHSDYAKLPTRPLILIEPCYEDNNNNTPYQVRRAISWGITSGGFGMAYGSKNIYKYIQPDWKEMMDRPAFNQFVKIADMIKSREWYKLVPDVGTKLLRVGQMKYNSVDYASASIASDGSFAVAYIPTARKITIDMNIFNGKKTVKWYDPTNNTFETVGVYENSGVHSITARPANAGGDSDWYLIIE